MDAIRAPVSVSITELKKNPSAVIEQANGEPVAVLNHNRPTAYLVPAGTFERLMDVIEDIELAEIVRSRKGEKTISVSIDET